MTEEFRKIISWIKKNEANFFIGLSIAVAIALIAATFIESNKPVKGMEAPDTYIPPGHVLVPIDLANAEALDAIVSDFAVVNLLQTSNQGKQIRSVVAKNLKLIRGPLNPSKFAVLVPESRLSIVLEAKSPFYAVVQSRAETNRDVQTKDPPQVSRITYFKKGAQQ